jgi:hypothetical protein
VLVQKYLWCQVLRGTAERGSKLVGAKIRLREPKVTESDMPSSVKENVFRLQIPESAYERDRIRCFVIRI